MKKIISTTNAPKAIGPYSQAVEANGVLYISGQIPVDPTTGNIPDTIESQAELCLNNTKAILEAAGYSLKNVVKSTVLLDNIENFAAMNEVYATFYTANSPARACYEVAKLPKNVMIEIETIACK